MYLWIFKLDFTRVRGFFLSLDQFGLLKPAMVFWQPLIGVLSVFEFETRFGRVFCAWFEVEFPEGYLSFEGSSVEVAGVALRFDEFLVRKFLAAVAAVSGLFLHWF